MKSSAPITMKISRMGLFILGIGLLIACKKVDGPIIDPSTATFDEVIASGGLPENVIEKEEVSTIAENVPQLVNGEEWKCTTKRYDVTKGQEDFPLFNPNANVIYPGSLLQGKSLNKSTPDPIVVKRAGGTISYDLNNANGQPFVEVDEVTKGKVSGAMNTIIDNSPDAFPANISIDVKEVQSRKQLAIEMGLDVNTRFSEVESDLSFSTDRSYSRFLVKLNQSYYTMSFDLPTSLDEIFAPEVTPEDLARFVGPGNPATFISDVTYGRIFYMLIESTESATKMEASINASFNGLVNKVEGNLDVESLNKLSNLRIKVVALGGDAAGTINMLGETDLNVIAQRLGESTDIRAGLPVSYIVRSVAQPDQIVNVKLATEYDVTECVPAAPGRFEFLNVQTTTLSINAGYETLFGDVNGDGMQDIILNHHQASDNQVQVGLANGDGNFTFRMYQNLTASAPLTSSWTDYGVKTGDINGDGMADLVWNNMIETPANITDNTVYVALGQSDGSFQFVNTPMVETGGWGRWYRFYLLDYNGDGKDELVWNEENQNSRNRVYTAIANAEGIFTFTQGYQDFPLSYLFYQLLIGDINGDGREDLTWEELYSSEHVTFGRADAVNEGRFIKGNEYFLANGFDSYHAHMGDVDGDGRDDLILDDTDPARTDGGAIWVGFSNGTQVSSKKLSKGFFLWDPDNKRRFSTQIGDINEDGKADIIWNDKGGLANIIHVGLAKANQGNENIFSFETAKQEHPDGGVNWDSFNDAVLADVNGDGKPDLLWVAESQTIKVSVALAY